MTDFTYEVWQGGIVVASVSGPDQDRAQREILHYAMQYVQDGPITIKGPDIDQDVRRAFG